VDFLPSHPCLTSNHLEPLPTLHKEAPASRSQRGPLQQGELAYGAACTVSRYLGPLLRQRIRLTLDRLGILDDHDRASQEVAEPPAIWQYPGEQVYPDAHTERCQVIYHRGAGV
jgi:hypothetical protein